MTAPDVIFCLIVMFILMVLVQKINKAEQLDLWADVKEPDDYAPFEVLDRDTFSPIRLNVGDSLEVTWQDRNNNETVLCKHRFDAESDAMVIDEAVLFRTRFEGRRAVGGMVLEQVEK